MKPSPLRLQLGVFLALSLTALWTFTLYEANRMESNALATAAVETRGIARAFSENAQSTIKRIDLVLIELGRTWSVRPQDFVDEIARHQQDIADVAIQVAVTDKDGAMVFSNLTRPKQHLSLADRDHVATHIRAGDGSGGLFISKPVLGRVSGKWSLQFTRPLMRDGRFDGVIIISVDPALFGRFHEALALAPHSVTAMVRDSGEIMARAPQLLQYIGKPLLQAPFQERHAALQGNFRRASQLDGVERLFGYYRLPQYQMSFISGLPVEQILAPLRRQRLILFGIALALSTLLLLMGLLIRRGLRARDRSEAAIRALNGELSMAASVFHNTMDGIMISDRDGVVLSVNPAFTAITGYRADEVLGRQPRLLRAGQHGPDFYPALWDALRRDGHWQGELWNWHKNGEGFLEWLSIGAIAGGGGAPERYIAVFNDITELRKKDEHIRHLAFHDALTGLPNRALLLDRLEHGLAAAQRENSRLGVMFIDLDRFKQINDTLGHDIGDHLLKEVAQRLRQCLREADTVARMGGDEFVILLEHVEEAGAYAALAHKLIACLSAPMLLGEHRLQVGASVGIACFPGDGGAAVELMKHADTAMYAAKAAGRGTYCFFRAAMTEQAGLRLQLETELRQAIGKGQLELYYQPKVAFGQDSGTRVEALLRWRHPVHGMVEPADFIPLAEESGLINELGDWVLEQACRQSRLWQQHQLGRIKIAVNVSAKQLEQGGLVERIAELTRQYQIAPADLEIELTESVIMRQPEQMTLLLARLRALGVRIAIDDFGTGYSSLSCLRRLPIDVIKIDRSFVMNAERDPGDAEVVKIIVALGQALRLDIVAEGVETGGQAALLRALGCDMAQGYFYSRPLPVAALEAWLELESAC